MTGGAPPSASHAGVSSTRNVGIDARGAPPPSRPLGAPPLAEYRYKWVCYDPEPSCVRRPGHQVRMLKYWQCAVCWEQLARASRGCNLPPRRDNCGCIFLDCRGYPLLPNRPCFIRAGHPKLEMEVDLHGYGQLLFFEGVHPSGGFTLLSHLHINHWNDSDVEEFSQALGILHCDIVGMAAFLPLQRGIGMYRFVKRCRNNVYLAEFLTWLGVVRMRLCCTRLRASIAPNAVDFSWCSAMVAED